MRASKRDELVEKALISFYNNGFHATGMDMIVIESGISKTSIYNHFRTKEDLILAVLRLRDEKFRNWLFRRMEELADTAKGQLLAVFDALDEWFQKDDFKGCLFIKASSEYQRPDHPIHKQAAEHKRLLHLHFEALAARTGLQAPDQVARQILLLKEGAIVTAQLQGSENAAGDAKAAAKYILERLEEGR
ncbi:TetR/AcrR family transcriptional regulator [Kordiimonas sp. SCSIO 12610]|uniref:TetR/AcrR family transcriptional regulator n=1 Tax=Kordiimonas sp. SCSIO 12610 TaxID=2829597 RepID=UPI002108E906|nr:TetR family transcriptional regulator [Kordiimonas sp. SCSIO 12610]UTW56142.1 TetR family transcriptional regulator [Kordiimonas sp. SCSIO 12610]